ncbi:MAG: hypothetical protein ABSF08_07460 [Candidatus Cybelea sp.]
MRSVVGRYALSNCVAAAMLASCGGSQPPIGAPSAMPQTSTLATHADRGKSWMAPGARKSDPWLYVTGNGSNNVVIYDLVQSGFPELGTITNGVSSPAGVTVDASGQVYVANESGTVTIYPPGKTSPRLTLSDDLSQPQSVAVDANGNVYVCDRGNSPAIVVFPPGESTPSQVITNDLIQIPNQVQFDAAGDLYYSDNNTGVSEIPAGYQSMSSLNLQGLQSTRGLALDHYGNLYVGTCCKPGFDGAREYVPGDEQPVRSLHDSEGSDIYASGVVKKNQYIFLPDSYNSTVRAFIPNTRKPAFVINTADAQTSVGVAVKPAGIP